MRLQMIFRVEKPDPFDKFDTKVGRIVYLIRNINNLGNRVRSDTRSRIYNACIFRYENDGSRSGILESLAFKLICYVLKIDNKYVPLYC
jgi:hypothetical protein